MLDRLTQGAKKLNKPNYEGELFQPPGGGFIGYRPVSTSGPPTIEVRIPGLRDIKLKFLGN